MSKQSRSKSAQGAGIDARKQRRTPAQRRVRASLGSLSRMWNELTEEQRSALASRRP